MENLQVTSLEQLKKVKQTDIVNLGKFEDGTKDISIAGRILSKRKEDLPPRQALFFCNYICIG